MSQSHLGKYQLLRQRDPYTPSATTRKIGKMASADFGFTPKFASPWVQSIFAPILGVSVPFTRRTERFFDVAEVVIL
jgi:hypothetical protein